MYSKYHSPSDRPIRVPEHYSGVAFSEKAQKPTEPTPQRQVEIASPTPPTERVERSVGMPPPPRPILLPPKEAPFKHAEQPTKAPPLPPPAAEYASAERNADKKELPTHNPIGNAAFLQPFRGLFGQMGSAFPFSHGLGFEELLLLGLIVLLSSCEQGAEIVLWLALLLFCG